MITIKGLRKSFGRAEVLCGIDLSVAESEVVVIIGPSGSEKSTLLRCINYLEEPTAGSVEIDGTVLRHDTSINTVRAEVGMVFQRFNLFPHMTFNHLLFIFYTDWSVLFILLFLSHVKYKRYKYFKKF